MRRKTDYVERRKYLVIVNRFYNDLQCVFKPFS